MIVNKFQYSKLNKVTESSGFRTYKVDNIKLPSVTTILDIMSDKSAIDSWRKRIGKEEADNITKLSADIGSRMHDNLENYLRGNEMAKGSAYVRRVGRDLANVVVEKGLCNVNEIWGLEEHLYYPGLYAGTADVIGVWKGKPAIMDFKNARKPKKEEYIKNYFLQLSAYALAHNKMHGTNIKRGVIMMVSREEPYYGEYQQFEINVEDYVNEWLDMVEQYYEGI